MNKILHIITLCLIAMWVLTSCKDDKDTTSEMKYEPIEVTDTVIFTVEPGKWVYYNIKEKRILGTSDIGDDEQDAEWGAQKDWDIAFCETGIRTNSGTSGKGKGGLAKINDSIYSVPRVSSVNSLVYSPDITGINILKVLEE